MSEQPVCMAWNPPISYYFLVRNGVTIGDAKCYQHRASLIALEGDL